MDDIAKAYTMLELAPGASLSDVNQAYKDLVFIWHPDRIPADNTRLRDKAQDKLKHLNEARGVLREHLRHGTHTASKASKNTNKYNPERYGRSRYRSYSRYHHSYGGAAQSTNGSSSKTANSNHSSNNTSNGNDYRSTNTARASGFANSATPPKNPANGAANRAASKPPNKDSTASSNGSSRRYSSSYSSSDRTNADNRPSHSSNGRGPAAVPRPVSDGYADYIYQVPQSSPYTPPQPSAASRQPDLEGSDFKGANLKEKDFSGRNLSKSNLEGADLSDAFLHKVNLNQANLQKAKLFRANLLQANLSHANLREANLIGADLSGADLSGADLSGAVVGYGNKIMVKLTAAKLTGTIMPNGNIHE